MPTGSSASLQSSATYGATEPQARCQETRGRSLRAGAWRAGAQCDSPKRHVSSGCPKRDTAASACVRFQTRTARVPMFRITGRHGLRWKFNLALLPAVAVILGVLGLMDSVHEREAVFAAHVMHAAGTAAAIVPPLNPTPGAVARRSLFVHGIYALVLLSLIALAMNVALSRFVLKPLDLIRHDIGQMERGHWRLPVHPTDADEVGSVVESMQPLGLTIDAPIGQVADISLTTGPTVIRTEQAQLLGYVYVDVADRDIGGYVDDAKRVVGEMVKLPEGYYLEWSGQYEYMLRAKARLALVIPVTLLIVIVLLYFNTRNLAKVAIVLLAVPFSLIGAFWLLYLLGYNLSVAVWVGIIALAGVDAETGVVMLLYLDQAFAKYRTAGRMNTLQDLHEAVEEGAVKRIRPKMMTVMAILLGLLPIMWSTGAGADVMKRIAAPMVGGVVTSFVLELLIYPVVFTIWKWYTDVKPSLARTTPVQA
ncbi:MAG: efflux RND transporter permease subunit [Cyanobacteria bacterium]|nr:efflux RND transporter permease subunit [Cyanobacteriota bacterium]